MSRFLNSSLVWQPIQFCHSFIIFTLNVKHVLLGLDYQDTDTEHLLDPFNHIPLPLIQTVDSSKFYGIYSNPFLFFCFFFALRVQKLVGL